MPSSVRKPARLKSLVTTYRVPLSIIALCLLPWLLPSKALAVNVLVYGVVAVGYNLLFGYTGLLSFGHAAFVGAGAYITGIAIGQFGVPWYAAVLLGVIGGGLLAFAIGALSTRTRGIYFSMVTLALAQLVYYVALQASSWTGGENGLRGFTVNKINLLGYDVNFLDPVNKYYVLMAFAALALWIVSRILNSPFGAAIEAIRENERRARTCGYNVERTKLLSFTLSGTICALGGTMSALHLAFVPLDSLHYHASGMIVMMTLLGGASSFFGPFVGALVFLVMEDVFSLWTSHWQIIVGSIFVLFVLFLPKGIWGTFLARVDAMNAPLLAVDDIGVRFGGFVALQGVTTAFHPGRVTSIIGPNGAGKSTLFNVLSGVLTPSSGSIRFKGQDLKGTRQHEFVHRGIARSYQITNIFPDLTVHENVRVAAQASRSRYNIWTNRKRFSELDVRADAALEAVGLVAKRDEIAKFLAHGQQRALEIAIALISDPEVLLLDEPTAGMGPEETKEMVALLERLASGANDPAGRAQDEDDPRPQRPNPGAAPWAADRRRLAA